MQDLFLTALTRTHEFVSTCRRAPFTECVGRRRRVLSLPASGGELPFAMTRNRPRCPILIHGRMSVCGMPRGLNVALAHRNTNSVSPQGLGTPGNAPSRWHTKCKAMRGRF
jgi:hypothetical protein